MRLWDDVLAQGTRLAEGGRLGEVAPYLASERYARLGTTRFHFHFVRRFKAIYELPPFCKTCRFDVEVKIDCTNLSGLP